MRKFSLLSYIVTASILLLICSSSEKNDGDVQAISTLSEKDVRVSVPLLSNRQIYKEIQRPASDEKIPGSSGEKATRNVDTTPAMTGPIPAAVPDLKDISKLSSGVIAFNYKRNKTHATPEIPQLNNKLLKEYGGFYVFNTSQKVIYLTFDEGYENGFTPSILDTLKKYNVKASFFATRPFITGNPSLVKRMVEEGHSVLNHTVTHRSMNLLSEKELYDELKGVEDAFKNVTGKSMARYVRPPKGEFSEKSLYMTKALGYKTIFWSISYVDWDTASQPSRETALSLIQNNHHNGAIILLHAVSKTNADTLSDMIKVLIDNGYRFELVESIK